MTWSKVLKWDICAGFTTQHYSAQAGSIIHGHQHHQLWTHLFFIYGSGNFRAPNCHITHSAIRILHSCLTHITRWINHFQCTGTANAAFTLRATQSTSHQEFLLPTELTSQGKNQPNFSASTAATIKPDFSSSVVPYWYDFTHISIKVGAVDSSLSNLLSSPQLWVLEFLGMVTHIISSG